MKSRIMINVTIIFYLFSLFPFFVYAAAISLPYHRDFESDTVDTTMDDGNTIYQDLSDWDKKLESAFKNHIGLTTGGTSEFNSWYFNKIENNQIIFNDARFLLDVRELLGL